MSAELTRNDRTAMQLNSRPLLRLEGNRGFTTLRASKAAPFGRRFIGLSASRFRCCLSSTSLGPGHQIRVDDSRDDLHELENAAAQVKSNTAAITGQQRLVRACRNGHGSKACAKEPVIEIIDYFARYYSLDHGSGPAQNPSRHEDKVSGTNQTNPPRRNANEHGSVKH